ncbi:antitoxin YezG family protein [Aneurinibacillus thermoaerophilus]|uniref:antitoxin YezG family protein n=1 Tax=Aneurinibacillus thermoaerophilus TaxID=143495 RepID=UPI002E1FC84F|nr:antitoxin YezG family protein [Aneurinibacillus thermoaerophilus]MED0763280.1 antitoxin YezG family protein [Aneurinibacillus thermoaerophilus]
MDEIKLGNIYHKIAQTVIETIPEEWSKVFVYGEIGDDVRTAFFYYYPSNDNMPIHSHNIPNLFNMDTEEYKTLWRQLLDDFEELWYEFKNSGQELWTNVTFIFDSTGEFKVDYNYEDLSDADDYERRIIWKHKYLGLIPEDDDDREFLEEYLKSIEDKTE